MIRSTWDMVWNRLSCLCILYYDNKGKELKTNDQFTGCLCSGLDLYYQPDIVTNIRCNDPRYYIEAYFKLYDTCHFY